MAVSSLSSPFLSSSGPQVKLTSPTTAVSQIQGTVTQLTAGGLSLQAEGQLEQQLVKQITAANPAANQAEIANIAADLWGATSSTQIQTDLAALERMVVPVTSVQQLASTITTIANLLRGPSSSSSSSQTSTPAAVNSVVAATALAGATSLQVTSATGMTAGDSLLVQLDSGTQFYTAIASISSNTLTLTRPLPTNPPTTQVSNGNTVSATPGISTYLTTLSATALSGTNSITLTTAAGISIGDSIQITLDNGVLFTTNVTGVSTTNNVVNLAAPLSGQASAGNDIADRTNPFTPVNQLTSVSATGTVINYLATLTATAAAGASSVTLDTVGGMSVGDTVQILLDNSSTFSTTINAINTTTKTVTLGLSLPSQASAGNAFTDPVTLVPASAAYVPSALISAIFALQLDNLITGANPGVDLAKLQKDVAALSKAGLTALQFQQALTTLNQLWRTGLNSATRLSLTA
jgi:hypothetical protein